MPDNDIFTRYQAKAWRTATRCLHSDAEPHEVASMLMKGIVRCLTHTGGLPAFPKLVDIYWEFLRGCSTPAATFDALRSLQREGLHNRNVQLGVRAVERLMATPSASTEEYGACGQRVAEAFLSELVDHNVLDPRIPEIENLRRFPTLADRYERADECRSALAADGRLQHLAGALVTDPACAKMRVPRRPAPAATTETILTYTVG